MTTTSGEYTQHKAGEPLHCVGCGRAIATFDPKITLALSCACGATSPIFTFNNDDKDPEIIMLPASLVRASIEYSLTRKPQQVAHVEFYLGFSDFDSPAKQAWLKNLIAIGSVSYKDCEDKTCQESYKKGRAGLANLH